MRKDKKTVHPMHVVEQWESWETAYTCDVCGRMISREDHGSGYAHELVVGLDMEECVNLYRRRDLCPACLDPIWVAINKLLGVEDPDAERDRDYDD